MSVTCGMPVLHTLELSNNRWITKDKILHVSENYDVYTSTYSTRVLLIAFNPSGSDSATQNQ